MPDPQAVKGTVSHYNRLIFATLKAELRAYQLVGRRRHIALVAFFDTWPRRGVDQSLFDADTERLIGYGIVGPSAGDLIAEAALAIEMGADASDVALTIHPNPTLSETIRLAAEAFEGTITDPCLPKRGREQYSAAWAS